jgi:hypothetical protein
MTRTPDTLVQLYTAGLLSDNVTVNNIVMNAWTDATDAHGRMNSDDATTITPDHIDTFYTSVGMQLDHVWALTEVVAFFNGKL